MPPPRIERTALRWLLRAALLATVAVAVWSTLARRSPAAGGMRLADGAGGLSSYGPLATLDALVEPADPDALPESASSASSSSTLAQLAGPDALPEPDSLPEPTSRGNALVVVSQRGDNVSWLEGVLPGWERNVYVVDGAALEEGATRLRIPRNKGREGMVYLSFIIDNYDRLPDVTLFLHSARYQWHNDDPEYDGIPILQNLRLAHVHAQGYVNLRCGWTLGCPAEIQPGRHAWTDDNDEATAPRTEHHYAEAWAALFPGEPVPEVVGVGCCA
ncbi:hypothetical protein MMC15_006873, partial [Xylographa vitiligo]|nr:hypothetical protein [Xylographa vitiligo]